MTRAGNCAGMYVFVVVAMFSSGCTSTDTAAPVVDIGELRQETPPTESRASSDVAPQSESQPAPTQPPPPRSTQSSTREPATRETQPAAQQAKAPAPTTNRRTASKPYQQGDWRPEFYIVRKGDTLYSIALDFGREYRDLAYWNRLDDPSYIQIGQKLRLFPGKNQVPTISEPKAYRAQYSEQAYARLRQTLSGEVQTAATNERPATSTTRKPAQGEKPAPTSTNTPVKKVRNNGPLKWEWPAQGKVIYKFSTGPNKKGVAISGKAGQPVVSSAPGKVVYSGSGLRGYGNLLIVKHNETYLSVYAHNSQLLVREGQWVASGQRIAVMGEIPGQSTALHFEIRRLGKPVDPLSRLPARPS